MDHPISPSVRNLQHWIEDAWEAGFDPEGARELKSLVGTKKWIGTSDLQTAFTFRGIPFVFNQIRSTKANICATRAKLVDFDLKKNERGGLFNSFRFFNLTRPFRSRDLD